MKFGLGSPLGLREKKMAQAARKRKAKVMKAQKIRNHVSHRQVSMAVRQFLQRGGIIVKLPEQKNQEKPVVGGEKYQNYESLTSILSA